MHTVHVITVLTTQRLVELTRITGCRPVVESVAVTVSGGGTTAEPVHLTEIQNYLQLHLTVSPSPVHFALASQSLHVHHTNHLVSCPF